MPFRAGSLTSFFLTGSGFCTVFGLGTILLAGRTSFVFLRSIPARIFSISCRSMTYLFQPYGDMVFQALPLGNSGSCLRRQARKGLVNQRCHGSGVLPGNSRAASTPHSNDESFGFPFRTVSCFLFPNIQSYAEPFSPSVMVKRKSIPT